MRKLFNSDFRITQGFGARPEYYSQWGLKGHEGLDLVPTKNDWTVFCLADGVVVKDDDIAGDKRTDAYGINVTIWHPKISKATQYCHLVDNCVSLNETVIAGDKIGKMGATGNTDGAHVHLNLFQTDIEGYRKNKDNGYNGGIDPLPFLEADPTIITQPIAQQPQITDQTRIPQIENKEVQQIKAELKAKDTKIEDLQNDLINSEIDNNRLINDLAKAVQTTKDFEELYKEAIKGQQTPNLPSESPSSPNPFYNFLKSLWLGIFK